MPIGNISASLVNELTGGLSFDGGLGSSDGFGNISAVTLLGLLLMQPSSATSLAIATAGTIPTAGIGVARVTPAAAVTGVILAAGTKNGQIVAVRHDGVVGNTITFAASGTSFVADGVADVITGPSTRFFIWDTVTALWSPVH